MEIKLIYIAAEPPIILPRVAAGVVSNHRLAASMQKPLHADINPSQRELSSSALTTQLSDLSTQIRPGF